MVNICILFPFKSICDHAVYISLFNEMGQKLSIFGQHFSKTTQPEEVSVTAVEKSKGRKQKVWKEMLIPLYSSPNSAIVIVLEPT